MNIAIKIFLLSKLVTIALVLLLLGVFLYDMIPYIMLAPLDFVTYLVWKGSFKLVSFFFGIFMWMLTWLYFYKIIFEFIDKESLMVNYKAYKPLAHLYVAILSLFMLSYLVLDKLQNIVNVLSKNYPLRLHKYLQENIDQLLINNGLHLLLYLLMWIFALLYVVKLKKYLYFKSPEQIR